MITYQVIQEVLFHPDLGNYTTYGICAFQGEGSIREKILQISDIFLQRDEAVRLTEQCNRLALSPIHLMDVVADNI